MESPLSIYLHIPFCRSKCTYCAFNTYTRLEHLIDPFVEALITEIRIVGSSQQIPQKVHTIFFGGGTPSLLSEAHLNHILEAVHTTFDVENQAEVSLEANPNDITQGYLQALRRAGINRLSLGVQSTNHNELRLFARRHDNDEVAQAVAAARTTNFNSVNIDLIYGIPHQTLDNWRWTLEQTLALKPDHLSLYGLGLEDGTPLKDWVMQGILPLPDEDLAADMYDFASEHLAAAGYEQYEISNWAMPGHHCNHNLQYWRNLPYIGVGPGAHGYAGGRRYWTVLSPQRYIHLLQEAAPTEWEFPLTPAVDDSVIISAEDEISETLIMGLRLLKEGINRASFIQRFGKDLLDMHGATLEKFASLGLIEINAVRVQLTQKGRLVSNALFRELV